MQPLSSWCPLVDYRSAFIPLNLCMCESCDEYNIIGSVHEMQRKTLRWEHLARASQNAEVKVKRHAINNYRHRYWNVIIINLMQCLI